MAGIGWKWLEWLEMARGAGNGLKLLEIAGSLWKWLKWLDMAGMDGNG